MITNLQKFQTDLRAAAKRVPEQVVRPFVQKIALTALASLIQKTPVDEGTAKGNWQVAIGKNRNSRVLTVKDKSGAAALAKGSATILGAKGIPSFTLFNNLSYIRVLDEGGFVPPNPGPSKDPRKGRHGRILVKGGYSVQAPKGMVDLTVRKLRRMIK